GWSRTSSPGPLNVSGWCNFYIPTASEIEDYPKLGHNDGFIIIGTNGFSDGLGYPFNGSNVFTIPKPATGDQSCGVPAYYNLYGPLTDRNGYLEGTPVPVDLMTSSAWGYVVATTDVTGPTYTDSNIRVWPVDGAGHLLAPTDLPTTASYSQPPVARQPGGLLGIDT